MSAEFNEDDYGPEFSEFIFSANYILDDLLAGLANKTIDTKELEDSLKMLKELVDCIDFMHSETQGSGAE
jgi:hypothetical protein